MMALEQTGRKCTKCKDASSIDGNEQQEGLISTDLPKRLAIHAAESGVCMLYRLELLTLGRAFVAVADLHFSLASCVLYAVGERKHGNLVHFVRAWEYLSVNIAITA